MNQFNKAHNFVPYNEIRNPQPLIHTEIDKYPWHKYEIHTPEEQQAKNYLDSEFTKLPEIGGHKFNQKEISDFSKFFGKNTKDPKFAEMKKKEIYWKAYLRKYHNFSHDYHRVVAHPEVTVHDKEYLEGQAAKIPNKLILSQFLGFCSMVWLYYGTDFGRKKLRKNLKLTVAGFSLLPVVVLFGGYHICHYNLDRLTWSSGLADKYLLPELNSDKNLAELTKY